MSSPSSALQRAIQLFQMMGKSRSFNTIFSTVNLVSVGKDRVKAEYVVLEDHCNNFGTLHGGFTASTIDSLTTLALMTSEKDPRPGVSLNLSVNYLRALKVGEKVVFEGEVVRRGRSIAYTTASVFNEKGALAAHATHVKHLGN